MIAIRQQILDILQKAYQIEVDGYTFYSMTAERAEKPAVRELFEKLARDEVEHQAYLKSVIGHYDEQGTAAFRLARKLPRMGSFSDRIFTDRFRQEAQGASFEFAVLSIGMQLESNAISYFANAARTAGDDEVRTFYQFLADWEKEHLAALQEIHESVRSDFWAHSGFAPF